MDLILFFKKPNFTLLKEFRSECGTPLYEYTYNFKRYVTDTWPPKIVQGPPLKQVIRESDGKDVTHRALHFAGPKKNVINRFGIADSVPRISFSLGRGLGVKVQWVPTKYSGAVTSTDFFNKKNQIIL